MNHNFSEIPNFIWKSTGDKVLSTLQESFTIFGCLKIWSGPFPYWSWFFEDKKILHLWLQKSWLIDFAAPTMI